MLHTLIRLLVVVPLVVSCGTSDACPSEPDESPTPLAAGFSGSWGGAFVITSDGVELASDDMRLDVRVVASDTIEISGICPGMPLAMTGSWRTAYWVGSYICPIVPFGACTSISATYIEAVASYSGGELGMTIAGTIDQCGRTTNLVSTFSGHH